MVEKQDGQGGVKHGVKSSRVSYVGNMGIWQRTSGDSIGYTSVIPMKGKYKSIDIISLIPFEIKCSRKLNLTHTPKL